LALDAVELSIACMATMDGSIVSTHWFECFRTWLSSSFKVTYFWELTLKNFPYTLFATLVLFAER
jgi:hypothetical protein